MLTYMHFENPQYLRNTQVQKKIRCKGKPSLTLPDDHISSKDITLNPSKGTLLGLLLAIHGEREVFGHEIHKACHIASTSCCCSSQRCWRGCKRSCRRECSCSCRHSCHLSLQSLPFSFYTCFLYPFLLESHSWLNICLGAIKDFAVLPIPETNSRNLLEMICYTPINWGVCKLLLNLRMAMKLETWHYKIWFLNGVKIYTK